MKYGVIDIGSNTIRLVVYRIIDGRIEYLLNKKIFATAVNYKKNGRMQMDGVKAIIDTLEQLKELASHHELSHLWCFATASLRNITNSGDVLASIRESTGLNVAIISGGREAELGVKGLDYAFELRNAISIDLGGGSCEVSLIKDGELLERTSMDIGSVSVTKQYVSHIFPKKKEIEKIKHEVDTHIKNIEWLKKPEVDAAYAVGGSARAMCNIDKAISGSSQDIHGYRIFTDDIHPLYTKLLGFGIDGIRLADKHCPGRIFTLVPGMIIINRILVKACVPVMQLSRFGVREGYLLEKVAKL